MFGATWMTQKWDLWFFIFRFDLSLTVLKVCMGVVVNGTNVHRGYGLNDLLLTLTLGFGLFLHSHLRKYLFRNEWIPDGLNLCMQNQFSVNLAQWWELPDIVLPWLGYREGLSMLLQRRNQRVRRADGSQKRQRKERKERKTWSGLGKGIVDLSNLSSPEHLVLGIGCTLRQS